MYYNLNYHKSDEGREPGEVAVQVGELKIKASCHVEGILRGLVHEGFTVTIQEVRPRGVTRARGVMAADPSNYDNEPCCEGPCVMGQ